MGQAAAQGEGLFLFLEVQCAAQMGGLKGGRQTKNRVLWRQGVGCVFSARQLSDQLDVWVDSLLKLLRGPGSSWVVLVGRLWAGSAAGVSDPGLR